MTHSRSPMNATPHVPLTNPSMVPSQLNPPSVTKTRLRPHPTKLKIGRTMLLLHPVLSTILARIDSVIEKAESIPKVMRAKKKTKLNHAECGSCASAYGNATNARLGPPSATF